MKLREDLTELRELPLLDQQLKLRKEEGPDQDIPPCSGMNPGRSCGMTDPIAPLGFLQ
jgi:hypothetical protein